LPYGNGWERVRDEARPLSSETVRSPKATTVVAGRRGEGIAISWWAMYVGWDGLVHRR
jgi:hypothetical protein